jgi:hypothetical protein
VTIEQAVYILLSSHAPITALVSTRIFPGVWDQKVTTSPGMVYRLPADGRRKLIKTLDGGVALVEQPVQIFTGSDRMSVASAVDLLVIGRLHEFSGTVNDATVSPVESISVQSIFAADDGPVHAYHWNDKTQRHEFLTEFVCHFLDPTRLD